MSNEPKKGLSLQDALDNLDATTSSTQDIRRQLMTKFLPDVLSLDLKQDSNKDPEVYAAKSRFLNEFRGLLTDIDNSSKNHAQIKLKQKDTEMQGQALNVVDFLNKIKGKSQFPEANITMTHEEAEDLVQKRFEDSGSVVLDTELEMGGNKIQCERAADDGF